VTGETSLARSEDSNPLSVTWPLAAESIEPPLVVAIVGAALEFGVGLAVVAVAPAGDGLAVVVAAAVETPTGPAPLCVVVEVSATVSVEAAGPELPVEHEAAHTTAPNRARLEHQRATALFGDTRQTSPVILPAKSSPNSVASTPNMLRKVVYSLL
jgi:hypothetical protein